MIRGVAHASGGEGSIQILTDMPSEGTTPTNVTAHFHTNGNVGIGTTDPSLAKLHISGSGSTQRDLLALQSTNNHAQLRIISESTTYSSYIKFQDNSGAADRYLIQADVNDNLLFRPQGTGTAANQIIFNASGSVGIGTTSPKAPLHVGTGSAGNYFGGKTFSLSNTFADALSIELPNHAGCYVKVFVTGNWSLHSAIAYVGEFFIQNGDNGYSQPGLIISETDNTYNGSVSAQIVDSTTDTFVIQLKLSDTGSLTAQLSYQIMGTITTIS
jgi:hypothetical protein